MVLTATHIGHIHEVKALSHQIGHEVELPGAKYLHLIRRP